VYTTDIALGFFLVGIPIALVAGYLADVWYRTYVFGILTIFGSLACGASYFIQTYEQLFTARVLTGVGIGGVPPVIFSLLADFYPLVNRIEVATFVMVMMGIGVAAGQSVSGEIGPIYGWRLVTLTLISI
jgi:MFS family permease